MNHGLNYFRFYDIVVDDIRVLQEIFISFYMFGGLWVGLTKFDMTYQYDMNLTCFYVFDLSIIVFWSNSYIDPYNPFNKHIIFLSIHMTQNRFELIC